MRNPFIDRGALEPLRAWAGWAVFAPVAGLCCQVLPTYLVLGEESTSSAFGRHPLDHPPFPFFSRALSNPTPLPTLVCQFLLGALLALAQPRWWLAFVGLTVPLPLLFFCLSVFYDWSYDPTSHNLFVIGFPILLVMLALPPLAGGALTALIRHAVGRRGARDASAGDSSKPATDPAAAGIRTGLPTGTSILTRSLFVLRVGLVPFGSLALIANVPDLVTLTRVFWLTPSAPLAVLLEVLVVAVMVVGVLQVLHGTPVQMGACLRFATSRWPAILGLAIILIVAVAVGSLLLIVPGLIALCGFFVAMPALIVERLGVMKALERSWELTSGYKSAILLIVVVVAILELVGEGITLILPGVGVDVGVIGVTLFRYALDAITTALTAVAVVVTYHDLRVSREGLEAGALLEELASQV